MEIAVRTWTLGELAAKVGGEVVGDPSVLIERPVPAGSHDPRGITFAESEKYLAKALAGNVAAVIVPLHSPILDIPSVRHAEPRRAFGMVLALSHRPLPLSEGIHPAAVIDPTASVAPTARIGPFVTVARGAKIGDGAQVFPHCYVGEDCEIGDRAILYPRVTMYQDVVLGIGCIIHSGVVIGADGFGFQWTGDTQHKVPQVGRVVIGDNVEVGANSCIDRATCGDTVIANGVKIDNLVQIGHNVVIGEHTVIASQVGLSGSVSIGARVTMGGQAGVSDHLVVGDDVVLGGRTGVISSISAPGAYQGMPAQPIGPAMRVLAVQSKLPELVARIRALESEVERLSSDE